MIPQEIEDPIILLSLCNFSFSLQRLAVILQICKSREQKKLNKKVKETVILKSISWRNKGEIKEKKRKKSDVI